MEGNYLTAGDLALMRTEGHNGYYGGDYYCHHRGGKGMAATGIGLAAGLGGGALLLAIAGIWGVNKASEARSRGAENLSNANAKTVELLASVVAQEKTRTDGINVDVNQTLRSLTAATAQGGSASSQALATAEALALINNNGTGLNSAVGGCNYLRVARVSGSRLCGCGCDGNCCGE